MDRLHFILLAMLATFGTCGAIEDLGNLEIGESAPDFALPGIDGKTHTLAEYKDAKVLMIAFISNHCPSSHAAEGRMKKLIADMKDKSFVFVAINPNHPEAVRLDELGYSKYNDGFEDMKKYAAEAKFDFPYLYDGETQNTSKAYGCLATPHVFVFDAERKLRYKGRFDDSHLADPETVHDTDARNAVEALLAGQAVPVAETRPQGCSTKWREKAAQVATLAAQENKAPVEVATVDLAGIAALRKNETHKLRLFNVWATSCGPCVAEFPELVRASRQFQRRGLELITISTDDLKDAAKVKAFLERMGAGVERVPASLKAENRTTNNYLFSGANIDDLMKAIDPEWKGGIPHSVLVRPGGEILWRHNGAVDGDELRGKILEEFGPYYNN